MGGGHLSSWQVGDEEEGGNTSLPGLEVAEVAAAAAVGGDPLVLRRRRHDGVHPDSHRRQQRLERLDVPLRLWHRALRAAPPAATCVTAHTER